MHRALGLLILSLICATVWAAKPNLIKEMSYGDKEEHQVLGVGTNLVIGDEGQIFLLDPNRFEVQIFSPEFELQGSFGMRGKGPGEFEEPKVITRTQEGHLAVFDPTLKRLTLFDQKGKLVKGVRMEASSVAVYTPVMLAGDQAAFISAKSAEGKPIYDLSIYDANMQPAHSLIRLNVRPLDWSKSSEPSFWVEFLINEFELLASGMPVVTALDANTIAAARAHEYNITLYDLQGKVKGKINRDLKPKPFTDAAKVAAFEGVWTRLASDAFLSNNMPKPVFERAVERAEIPPALPVLQAMNMVGGHLAVLANYNHAKQEGQWDFFDKQGKLVAEIPYQGPADNFHGTDKHLYAIGANKEDNIVIHRFRLETGKTRSE